MEISEVQWNELCEKVNGFQTKIEELTNANTALKTENEGFEAKLQEWQTKLNDQQTTIDTLAAAKGQAGAGQPKDKPKTSGHKSVRFDPVQDKYVFK